MSLSSSSSIFICQKCAQPLKIDSSFDKNLNNEEFQKLITLTPKVTLDFEDGDNNVVGLGLHSLTSAQWDNHCNVSTNKISGAHKESCESGGEFTLLGDSDITSEQLSLKVKVAASLFDVISGQSELDHPLCEECTDTLLDELDKQYSAAQHESAVYKEFLKQLEENALYTLDESVLNEELKKLQEQETNLIERLSIIENDQKSYEEEYESAKKLQREIFSQEKAFWKEYNEYKSQVAEYENTEKSVDQQLKYTKSQLEKHKKTNVFNITFHIWHSGPFGTINGFRLGRLPNNPVDWCEINAAWGQTVLLLHSLAKRIKFTFKKYVLVPCGSQSYIESLADKSRDLPLYGTGGFKFFSDNKFDQAMVAFLDCLQQFKHEVSRYDSFCLPYLMDKGRLEDPNAKKWYSIKYQLHTEEQWTKALKFMLTNLKWALTWVTSQYDLV